MENKFNASRYFGLTIFQEAKKKDRDGYGYRAIRNITIWRSKKCSWNYLFLSYGIRWSDKNQYFPIWNTSNNSSRSIMIGFLKLHISFSYNRKGRYNQKTFLGRRVHQLFF
jgi:hypothetical protein